MPDDAAKSWAAALESWAIPEHIVRAAPESPHGFPTGLFRRAAEEALKSPGGPSLARALEALGDGGTVLDVGVGGGAASLPLAPPATFVTGVDQSAAMLEQFAHAAEARGVRHREVEGGWPGVSEEVEAADVVVCHHVFYNVADLPPFARALTDKARRRVVVELTERHPMSDLNDLWLHFHGLERPRRPTADDALAVLREMGLEPEVRRFSQRSWWREVGPERVAFVRKRLCLGSEHDEEIARLLGDRRTEMRTVATMWW